MPDDDLTERALTATVIDREMDPSEWDGSCPECGAHMDHVGDDLQGDGSTVSRWVCRDDRTHRIQERKTVTTIRFQRRTDPVEYAGRVAAQEMDEHGDADRANAVALSETYEMFSDLDDDPETKEAIQVAVSEVIDKKRAGGSPEMDAGG